MREQRIANRRRAFLKEYADCGIIGEAARRIGIDRSLHYHWLANAEYKQSFEAATNQACDKLVEEARRRAHDGWEEPIVYQGEIQRQLDAEGKPTGDPVTIRKYDSTLLMFLIKGMRPEVYRDTWKGEIAHSGTVTQRNPDLARLSTAKLRAVEAILADGETEEITSVNGNGHGKYPEGVLGSGNGQG